jgi:hypothetical protein
VDRPAVEALGTSATIGDLAHGARVTAHVEAVTAQGTGPASPSSNEAVANAVVPFATIDAFVDRQFRDFAGRAPTAAELSSWRQRIQARSHRPEQLVDELSRAAWWDGTLGRVYRMYRATFLRLPDDGGFDHWVAQFRRTGALLPIADYFAGSPEFVARYGSLGPSAFVDQVYRNVFGRAPDATGRAYWLRQLREAGQGGRLTRGGLMIEMSKQPEFLARYRHSTTVVLLVKGMLRRVPSAAEVAELEPVVAQHGAERAVAGLLDSRPYRTRLGL